MVSPSFIEKIESDLKRFATYLDNLTARDKDDNLKNLNESINAAINLLKKSKTKLTKKFNINSPDYPDEDLEILYTYQAKISKIKQEIQNIRGLNPSLKEKVTDLYKDIEHDIKVRIERGQPRAENLPTNF